MTGGSARRVAATKPGEPDASRSAASTAPTNGQTNGKSGGTRGSTRRELVENEMYEHATRLFAERGFAGTSLQDIADAMGVTRPALYYYVKSKDELLTKLVTEVTDGPAAAYAAVDARADLEPVAKLREVARIGVVRQATQPARFRLLVRSEADLPPALRDAHERGRRAVLKIVARIVEQGVVAGQLRPVDSRVAALAVIGMCNWVAFWFRPGRDNIDTVADQLADMALAGLQRADHRTPEAEGAVGALGMLRQDLDHLERILGL